MTERRVYQPSRSSRLFAFAVLAGLSIAAVAVIATPADKPWADRIGATTFLLLGGASAYVFGLRPRLEIDLDRVRIVAPFGTTQFPLDDVRHATGGRVLHLHLRSGAEAKVFAVSNANATLLLHRDGRTEEVADEINQLLESRSSSDNTRLIPPA